jgi:molybdate transport system ATP-binding protein
MAGALTLHFRKSFPKGPLIEADLRVDLDPPLITVLFGPSGSGKTTILRAPAGLERSKECTIRFGDETWVDDASGVFIRPQLRRIGLLFQDYALFPRLSVMGNIRYGLGRLSAMLFLLGAVLTLQVRPPVSSSNSNPTSVKI